MAIPGLNKNVLDKAIKVLGLQSLAEKLPTTLNPTIQPTLDLNPERFVNVVKTSFVDGTLYTTPTDREFYLTSACISAFDKANDASVLDKMVVTLESGETMDLLAVRNGSTATSANSTQMCMVYPFPIKLKKGTNIVMTEASDDATFTITGYTVDIL